MTLLKSLLVFLPSLALGLITVWHFWPANWRRAWPLILSVSIPVGLGLSSLLYFFWCLLAGPARPGFLILELVLIATGGVFCWKIHRNSSRTLSFALAPLGPKGTSAQHPTASASDAARAELAHVLVGTHAAVPPKPTKLSWALTALLVLLAATAGAYFLIYTRYAPNGSFDAYAFWNLKARFIFRDPANWQAAFSPLLSWEFHPDYPILLSLNTALGWFQVGSETPYVPAVQAALFTLACAGLLWSALQALRGWSQAALAALALLSTPLFMLVGVWQLADVPLATMVLATCILISLHFLHPDEKRGFLTLAGLTAGLAAWTKNEGLLFLALISLLLLVFSLRGREDKRQGLKELLSYGLGLLLPLAALLILKLAFAPANDLIGSRSPAELSALLFDPQRWRLTFRLMAAEAGSFGHSFFTVWLLPLAYLLLAGRRPLEDSHRQVLRFWVTAFILLLAGYFVTYLITPHPLEWHVTHSVERLYLHIYPAVLWLVFLVSRAPEEWKM
ncbi:MAG: glycosyltransferase family 39 protein [Anaerolineaceae bacterium]|jgi:hypothetical protein|nr:glycosyltransferase family 39 protein [Anaerolineaceae bacterium]